MKKLTLALSLALLLTACSGSYSVATSEDLKNNPELQPVIQAWQNMVDAANADDCSSLLAVMRKSLAVTDASCDAMITYLKDAPTIDWSRTDWSASAGKAKIYQENGASVTSFIHDTRDDIWRADDLFWEK